MTLSASGIGKPLKCSSFYDYIVSWYSLVAMILNIPILWSPGSMAYAGPFVFVLLKFFAIDRMLKIKVNTKGLITPYSSILKISLDNIWKSFCILLKCWKKKETPDSSAFTIYY